MACLERILAIADWLACDFTLLGTNLVILQTLQLQHLALLIKDRLKYLTHHFTIIGTCLGDNNL